MNLLEICERVFSLRLMYDKHQRRWNVTAILKDGTVWGGNGEDLEEVCKRIPSTFEVSSTPTTERRVLTVK